MFQALRCLFGRHIWSSTWRLFEMIDGQYTKTQRRICLACSKQSTSKSKVEK